MEKSVSKLKKELDKYFSLYIRLKFSDRKGNGKCYTCGKFAHYKKLQCGHFVSRQYLATRWEEDNCRIQCLTKESRLRLFDGKYISIKDIKVGDKLWAFNEDSFEKEVSLVENVKGFVPKELYEIELENGSKFYATPEHLIVFNDNWVSVKELLHMFTDGDIMEI